MYKTIIFLIFISASLVAQELNIPALPFSPEQYVCYKSSENICVDGKMSEKVWSKVEWTNDFVDIEGSLKPLPRFKTRAKMLWDEKYFYVAAELNEPDIWATLKNRDDIIFYDNDFEVFLDPDGDTHSYLEFEMNAFNTIWDLLLKQPYRDVDNAALHGFDVKGIKSGVSINGTLNKSGDVDKHWTVEIAFPWEAFKELTSIAIPPKESDQWRINFSRVEWQTEVVDGQYKKVINPATNKPFPEDNWVWSPQGVVNMHYPEMWGFVQFTNHHPGEKNVEFIYNVVEDVKWYLRQIYYKERNYFSTNGFYTSDLNILKIDNNIIPGFNMLPVIECTTNMFEAYIISDDGTLKVSINNSGLTEVKKIVK
jgi:hypothetical protein